VSCADVLPFDPDGDDAHAAEHPVCIICEGEGCAKDHPAACYCDSDPVDAILLPGMRFPETVHHGECRQIFELLGVPGLPRWMLATLFDISGGSSVPW
jgi:hypothetical protein